MIFRISEFKLNRQVTKVWSLILISALDLLWVPQYQYSKIYHDIFKKI